MPLDIPQFPVAVAGDTPCARLMLEEHWLRLSPASRRLRFLAAASDVWLRDLAARVSPDLLLGVEIDGSVRGILEAYDLGNGHGEVGISVEDAYQGRGLGGMLFDAGLRRMAGMGLGTADLFFSRGNSAIRHLVQAAGGHVVVDGNEATAFVALPDHLPDDLVPATV